jgi:hypothetical protein
MHVLLGDFKFFDLGGLGILTPVLPPLKTLIRNPAQMGLLN